MICSQGAAICTYCFKEVLSDKTSSQAKNKADLWLAEKTNDIIAEDIIADHRSGPFWSAEYPKCF